MSPRYGSQRLALPRAADLFYSTLSPEVDFGDGPMNIAIKNSRKYREAVSGKVDSQPKKRHHLIAGSILFIIMFSLLWMAAHGYVDLSSIKVQQNISQKDIREHQKESFTKKLLGINDLPDTFRKWEPVQDPPETKDSRSEFKKGIHAQTELLELQRASMPIYHVIAVMKDGIGAIHTIKTALDAHSSPTKAT